MKLLILLLFSLLSLVACEKSSGPTNQATGPITTPAKASDPPALRLVRERRMGQNLGPLAWSTAKTSNSLGLVVEKYGADKASAVIAVEIQKLIPNYIERWEEIMADAYAKQLTSSELASLAAQGSQSPYIQKLIASQTAVGNEMRVTGRPIVDELAAKALTNAITNAP